MQSSLRSFRGGKRRSLEKRFRTASSLLNSCYLNVLVENFLFGFYTKLPFLNIISINIGRFCCV